MNSESPEPPPIGCASLCGTFFMLSMGLVIIGGLQNNNSVMNLGFTFVIGSAVLYIIFSLLDGD